MVADDNSLNWFCLTALLEANEGLSIDETRADLGVKVEIRVDNFREVGIEFAERTAWDAERVAVPIRRPNMARVRRRNEAELSK